MHVGDENPNVGQRGSYDSDKAACLTLEEVEHWLTTAVATYYHQRPHEGLEGQTPLRRWQDMSKLQQRAF